VPRSVPLADAVAEAERLVAAGVREIVLTGINLGRYQDRDRDLTDLLTAISDTGVGRIRLSSIEPLDVNERLLDTLSSLPAACPHLHVPLQSGSDAVLAAMRRGYTVARYEQIIADARSALPRVAVTTDVIAGFPGESDGQAAETVDACERIGFAKLHVFRYSRREGTDAASMDQVPAALRGERAARLRELGNRLRQGFMERRLGSVAEVLIERFPEPGIAEGTTPDYLRVRLPLAEGFPVGSLVGARLVSLDGDVIHGVCE
jgi:threonylcarbamoyladenosine tRNA methylthiotransferase MtaB